MRKCWSARYRQIFFLIFLHNIELYQALNGKLNTFFIIYRILGCFVNVFKITWPFLAREQEFSKSSADPKWPHLEISVKFKIDMWSARELDFYAKKAIFNKSRMRSLIFRYLFKNRRSVETISTEDSGQSPWFTTSLKLWHSLTSQGQM